LVKNTGEKCFRRLSLDKLAAHAQFLQAVNPDTTMHTAGDRIRASIADQIMIDFVSPAMKR